MKTLIAPWRKLDGSNFPAPVRPRLASVEPALTRDSFLLIGCSCSRLAFLLVLSCNCMRSDPVVNDLCVFPAMYWLGESDFFPFGTQFNFERMGSFCVCNAIQGRKHSLLWSRSRNRTIGSKGDADSDARLVEGLRQRDEHAILNLYDRHRRSVYRFLLHMTGSIASAEELTQQVFVEILDSMWTGTIGQFDLEKGTLEGYLIGIARNLARVEGRRVRRSCSLWRALWSRLNGTGCSITFVRKMQIGIRRRCWCRCSRVRRFYTAELLNYRTTTGR